MFRRFDGGDTDYVFWAGESVFTVEGVGAGRVCVVSLGSGFLCETARKGSALNPWP